MAEREHLRRLGNVWLKNPLYFITACVGERRKILAAPATSAVVIESWHAAGHVHGRAVGRYVIMPDHVHFFARPHSEAKSLSAFVRDWKKWTTRQIAATIRINPPLWQPEFFDHVLRSADSYSEKWDYVYHNPVRAGFVATPDAWPYSGECNLLAF